MVSRELKTAVKCANCGYGEGLDVELVLGEHWPTMEELKGAYLRQAVAKFGDDRTLLAKVLGVSRDTVYTWMKAEKAKEEMV